MGGLLRVSGSKAFAVQLGAWLASRESVNPIPVALFAPYDASRMNDETGSGHAEAAAALFDLMQTSDIRYLLLPRDAERVRAISPGRIFVLARR